MGSVVVYGPYSPKEFSTLGAEDGNWGNGTGFTANSLNKRLYDDMNGEGTTFISVEPITVLGNVYLVVTR